MDEHDHRIAQILSTAAGLPTLPAVAADILKVVNDNESDVDDIVHVMQRDPALTAKILRVANSAIYGNLIGVESLQQAVIRLGLTATQSLALSFSLVSALKLQSDGILDYKQFWRRSLLAATAGKYLAARVIPQDSEAVFLASLMQDLGMLVLDRINPKLYSNMPCTQSHHSEVEELESQRFGMGHPGVGEWMMKEWGFSERMQHAVAYSHEPLEHAGDDEAFVRCVALSALLADTMIEPNSDADLPHLFMLGRSWLDLGETDLVAIIAELNDVIPSYEKMFDTSLINQQKLGMLSELAREKLAEMRKAQTAD